MRWITIKGVPPYDGRYQFTLEEAPLTFREWGWMKRNSGFQPWTLLDENWASAEVVATLAVVMLRRAGTIDTNEVEAVYDLILDAPYEGSVTLERDTATEEPVEDDADPSESSSGNGSSAGPSSKTTSGSSVLPPSPTGLPALATSGSAPLTSGI